MDGDLLGDPPVEITRVRPLRWLAVLGGALLLVGCGDHGHEATWRDRLLTVNPGAHPPPDITQLEYPPFTPGIFPCSRCHVGGPPVEDPTGPVFPHARHVDFGLGCADCHMPEGGATPALPKVEVCIGCHDKPEDADEGVKAYFATIRQEDGTYAFGGRWKTGDIVEHHPAHAAAKVECSVCHGEPKDTPILKPRPVPMMENCVACHEERGAPVQCATCHQRIRESQHANIVLHHAERQRSCFGCHNPDDRDTLRLANGNTLKFEDSYLLCGQCHGPKLRDWRLGLHGKRTGEWNGTKEYKLCVHCHSPHAPRFPPMHPMPRPPRPEEVR